MQRLIIDVREPSEFQTGHVKGAVNIPPAKLMSGAKELAGLDKNTELILYCRSGARSAASANILKAQGFTNIVNGINKGHVESRYL